MRFADSSEILVAFQAVFEDVSHPCVALMANSDNLGPHDGSLDGERFLDQLLLQPGRAVVLSAGNLNHVGGSDAASAAWHAFALAGPESDAPLPLVLRYDSGGTSPDSAEVWFRPPPGTDPAATISISVRGASIAPVTVGESTVPVTILRRDDNPVDMTTVDAQLQRDDEADAHCLRLVFRPAPFEEIVQSEWSIDVTATGPVHGWLDRNNDGIGRWVGQSAQAGANLTTLGSPASAARPLAVGSVASAAGNPSGFSGRGPLRASSNSPRKPDLVAVGENVPAPLGSPAARRQHVHPAGSSYKRCLPAGTSYAAPQVAGACVMLFQRFGITATWADIRQAILQATVRTPGMPPPEPDGWDSACGYGLLDLNLLLAPPAPVTADLWLPKVSGDTGTEPFVAETFWESLGADFGGRARARIGPCGGRSRRRDAGASSGEGGQSRRASCTGYRGGRLVGTARSHASAAAPGTRAAAPGGSSGFGVNARAGNLQRVTEIAPGAVDRAGVRLGAAARREDRVLPHLLLAAVDAEGDPYDPVDTLCAQNNAAALSVAAAERGCRRAFTSAARRTRTA